jgi:hypothetical protein
MTDIYFDKNKYQLSHQVLTQLKKLGFSKIEKSAEGSSVIVLKTKYEGKFYILLINKNSHCEEYIPINGGYKLIYELQENETINMKYIIGCYEPFWLENIRLSEDKNFCSKLETMSIEVGFEELAEEVLGKKIYRMLYTSVEEKVDFLVGLRNRLIEMYNYIYSKNLDFEDIHPGNFAYREIDNIDTLVFIDVDAFKNIKKPLKNKEAIEKHAIEQADWTIYDFVKPVFDINNDWIGARKGETIDNVIERLAENEIWDAFRGLYLTEEDRDAGLKLLKTKIDSRILF